MTIGERIKQRRIELNMTQDELAKRTGYKSRSSINKLESARVLPSRKIEKMAEALDCSPADLMGWKDGRKEFTFDEFMHHIMTDDENTLLTGFRAASRERREDMLDMARKAIREKERSSSSEREGIA